MDFQDRFMSKVVWNGDEDECWEWQGALSERGYGRVRNGSLLLQAHRVSYELLREPIPVGLELDHLCRNRGCVNPAHLEPVTHQENVQRGLAGLPKAACIHGHPFDEPNTYVSPKGKRACRRCKAIRDAKGRAGL